MVAPAGPSIIAEHLSTVKVWIDQVWDQSSKGVSGKADIEKIISFRRFFGV